MTRPSHIAVAAVAAFLAAGPALAALPFQPTAQQVISSAASAAPRAVSDNASVVTYDQRGVLRTLRQGSNNFTCMPDDPTTPGDDPICVDANGLEWILALAANKIPTPGKIGIGYRLQGGSDASNLDPMASAPADGATWIKSGPQILILNAGAALAGYPEAQTTPDPTRPFVMFAGTPYARLVIPVK